ncbi:hypothetical protein K438DRAFT_1863883 [Mycena galopus ATCC 62051]|nr:hypothetical protein K438DRAFT_1863883 [Mycena galopus ATCC 62051]
MRSRTLVSFCRQGRRAEGGHCNTTHACPAEARSVLFCFSLFSFFSLRLAPLSRCIFDFIHSFRPRTALSFLFKKPSFLPSCPIMFAHAISVAPLTFQLPPFSWSWLYLSSLYLPSRSYFSTRRCAETLGSSLVWCSGGWAGLGDVKGNGIGIGIGRGDARFLHLLVSVSMPCSSFFVFAPFFFRVRVRVRVHDVPSARPRGNKRARSGQRVRTRIYFPFFFLVFYLFIFLSFFSDSDSYFSFRGYPLFVFLASFLLLTSRLALAPLSRCIFYLFIPRSRGAFLLFLPSLKTFPSFLPAQ